MSKPFPRELAIHEAGHAVSDLAQGGYVEAVHLRTFAQVEAGDVITTRRGCERPDAIGLCESQGRRAPVPFAMFRDDPRSLLDGIYGGDLTVARDDIMQRMIVCAAGPVAESIYSGEYLDHVFENRGTGDVDQIDELAAMLAAVYGLISFSQRRGRAASRGSLFTEAVRKAERLVRRRWSEILAVADLVQPNRYTDGGDVSDVFFGSQLPRRTAQRNTHANYATNQCQPMTHSI
jgi:hypothetical protein